MTLRLSSSSTTIWFLSFKWLNWKRVASPIIHHLRSIGHLDRPLGVEWMVMVCTKWFHQKIFSAISFSDETNRTHKKSWRNFLSSLESFHLEVAINKKTKWIWCNFQMNRIPKDKRWQVISEGVGSKYIYRRFTNTFRNLSSCTHLMSAHSIRTYLWMSRHGGALNPCQKIPGMKWIPLEKRMLDSWFLS